MRKNKFWILFALVILLSLGSQLLGQVNRLLTLSPTAQEASLGNQSLTFRNPARNYFYNDSTINLSFTRVDWLRNITDDMGYNYISTAWKKFTFSLLHFDYGMQNHTDDTGIILGNFRPSSIVAYVGWGTALKYKVNKIENISIGFGSKIINHNLHTEKANGLLFDAGIYIKQLGNVVDLDVMIQNWGFPPKFNNYQTKLPTSLNAGFSVPVKDWKFYNQWNFYNGYYTHGQGISYNYKNMITTRFGYYNDVEHELNYSSLGLSFMYDKYDIGVGYIIGGEIFPLSNTLQLTINLEL